MAFDAGMLACTLHEIKQSALGARIEKVYQPERDEIILQMRSFEGGKRLLINAGTNNPRICFTELQKENPQNPPMFCMLLRKHLQGAKLVGIEQAEFDRVAVLRFEGRDEMGFECEKYLIAELMGKYSNLIFADGEKKVVSALRTSDFSENTQRPLFSGIKYEFPSTCGKVDPLNISREDFSDIFRRFIADKACAPQLVSAFSGISPVVAREIVFDATRHTDTPSRLCFEDELWESFDRVMTRIRDKNFAPCIVFDGDRCVEYSFMPIAQYGNFESRHVESAGKLLDTYFGTRDNEQRIHSRASDILKLLTNAESRIKRKMENQREELAECEKGEEYKKCGDLITANIYRLSRGDTSAELEDYENMDEDGNVPIKRIELDSRLTPSANAQRYYKRYNKSKNAKVELTKQIEIGERELEYIYTVFDALTKAETPSDLLEIRDELYRSGYASRMKSYVEHKSHTPSVMKFVTPDGMTVLCGKNNLQNEYITHRLARERDYWFHAKNKAGSHTLLVTEGREPTDLDFTSAAEIAAFYSKAQGDNIAVDYTLARHIKKPAGAKLGFVIYKTNYTAYVTPDAQKIAKWRK